MAQLQQVRKMIESQQAARPAVGGTIKKGESKDAAAAAGRKMPKDQNFFRMHPIAGWDHLVDDFSDSFGEEPQTFKAVLPFRSIEQNFETAFKLYGTEARGQAKGSLNRLCDGCNILQIREHSGQFITHNPTDGEGQSLGCCMNGKIPTEKASCGAQLTMELWLEVPALNQPCVYRVLSHAWSDVRTVMTGLASIQETLSRLNRMNPDFAQDLQGIPVQVSRRETTNSAQKRVKADGGGFAIVPGERTTRTDWNIYVEFDPDYYRSISMVLQAQQTMQLQGHVQRAQAALSGNGSPLPQIAGSASISTVPIDAVEIPSRIEDTRFWKTLGEYIPKTQSLEQFEKLLNWVDSKKSEVAYIRGSEASIEALLAPLYEQFAAYQDSVEAVPL